MQCPSGLMTDIIFQGNAVCFSKNRLPACPALCHATEVTTKHQTFRCYRDGDQSVEDGTEMVSEVTVPVRCEITVSEETMPDTTP